MAKYRLVILSFFFILFIISCNSNPPSINMGPDAYVSPEGLYRVDNSRLDLVLAKPDLDLSTYDSIMMGPVDITYKRNSYLLSDSQREEMLTTFADVLRETLAEGNYSLVDKPGPNVLYTNVKIIDLYINTPTEAPVGRSRIFTASSGEISLIGELRDSRSGELLVQFADRQRPRGYWSESTSVSSWAEARSAFRFWAGILIERLDYFHQNRTSLNF